MKATKQVLQNSTTAVKFEANEKPDRHFYKFIFAIWLISATIALLKISLMQQNTYSELNLCVPEGWVAKFLIYFVFPIVFIIQQVGILVSNGWLLYSLIQTLKLLTSGNFICSESFIL